MISKNVMVALLAVGAVSVVGVSSAYADVLFQYENKNVPPFVYVDIVDNDGKAYLTWLTTNSTADVTVKGKINALTASDIENNDTRFYDISEIYADITRISFPVNGHEHCVYVHEDHNNDNKSDAIRLVCD